MFSCSCKGSVQIHYSLLFRYIIPTLVALYWQIEVLVSSRCTLGIFKWAIILILVKSFKEYKLNKMGNTQYVNYKWIKNAIVKGEGGKQAVGISCNANMLKFVVKTSNLNIFQEQGFLWFLFFSNHF